jgi:hypothetical protein
MRRIVAPLIMITALGPAYAVCAGMPAAAGSAEHAVASGLRGDPTAIAAARAMVDAMGGARIWKPLKSLRLVHEWFPWNRSDSYVETETLDLRGPGSHADRRSEVSHEVRAYSPEGGGWRIREGKLARSSPEALAADLARAPFNFFRLVSAVAKDDPFYEPVVKATPDYRYTLGPLQRFGNLRLPAWGVYDNGYTRYEMRAAKGDHEPLDTSIFRVPPGYSE